LKTKFISLKAFQNTILLVTPKPFSLKKRLNSKSSPQMKTGFILFIVLLKTLPTFAQFSEPAHVAFYATSGIPVREFRGAVKNDLGDTGWGLGINVLLNPKKSGNFSPVMIGLEGNYIHLGTEKTPETVALPQLKTTYNYYSLGPVVRALLSRREEGIIPFLDGFVGMKVLNTKTRIDNTFLDTLLDREYLAKLLTTNNESMGYGIGLGFFNRRILSSGETTGNSFYLKLNYSYGDRLTYVKKGSIEVNKDGLISYKMGKTQTGMVSLQFGWMLF